MSKLCNIIKIEIKLKRRSLILSKQNFSIKLSPKQYLYIRQFDLIKLEIKDFDSTMASGPKRKGFEYMDNAKLNIPGTKSQHTVQR